MTGKEYSRIRRNDCARSGPAHQPLNPLRGHCRATLQWLAAPMLALVVSSAQAATDAEPGLLLQKRLEAHIAFLADDLLAGRRPGTPGYDIAAAYVASQFAQLGLVPAGTDGGWRQPVPLRRAQLEHGSAKLSARSDGDRVEFTFIDAFYTAPSLAHEHSRVGAPAVFAGYGIHAPELAYSDYSGLDVNGKIAVILSGKPVGFRSEEGAHFASYREKYRAAVEAGAVGLVRIHTPRRDRRMNWARYAGRVGAPAMGWIAADGRPFASFPELLTNTILHHAAASALFNGAPATLERLIHLDEAGEPLPRFPLRASVTASQRSRHDILHSPNVIGLLRGNDPLLSDEYVVYTAHLDHLGVLESADEGEDRINNGALDNAAGVAVLLETARLLSAGPRTRRSILFIAVTAEEKGLVGSEYFARHPTVPAESIVGAINLDMPLLLYDFGDVIAFGAEHSTLGEVAVRAATEFGVTVTPDPMPEENIFVRSDHYRFVQQGIPALFLVTGQQSLDGDVDPGPIFERFLALHYHRPSDDVSLPIDYRAAVRFTRINARIGELVANRYARPKWVEGDFFGRTYSR